MQMKLIAGDGKNRKQLIIDLLNVGHRQAEIARAVGLSRERIRQIVASQIDHSRLHIPCLWCGREMETDWGLTHFYHKACAIQAAELSRTEAAKGKRHFPRKHPDGEFEHKAVNI